MAGRDETLVVEHILIGARRVRGGEVSHRITRGQRGPEREEAVGVVERDDLAAETVVARRHRHRLLGGDNIVRGALIIPLVVESRRGGIGVGGRLATRFDSDVLLLAIQVEIGIAVVPALIAVVGGEAHPYVLPVVGAQVRAHGGPILPQDIAAGEVPAQRLVGDVVGGTAGGVHLRTALVKQLELKARLFRGGMVRVLQHGSVFQQENGCVIGVHVEGVGDALRLRPRAPVAQTDRVLFTRRQDVEKTGRPRIGGLHQVDGMAAGLCLPTIVNHTRIQIGIAESAVLAQDVGARQCGQVDAGRGVGHTGDK